MRVVLDDQRHLVVDHQVDALDVDAATGDVGGDQDVVLPLLEPPKRLLALILALAAVDGAHAVAHLEAQVRDVVHDALGVDEYDRLGVRVLRQHQLQLRRFLVGRGPLHNLLDEIRGFARASDGHHRGVAHVLPRQLLHARGHRRGEHVRHAVLGAEASLQSLLVDLFGFLLGLERFSRHGVHDGYDLRLEAHVDHPVRLVQHDVVALLKHGVPPL
mmetsp:Transcript_13355/g.56467  ORF Transcript_13355/g.56467 Transcript_13355/m.56467 type:complete len:216 (-) Transcript_13355:1437-2084(-)